MPMSDEAHLPAAKPKRARKPATRPSAQPRPRSRAKDAATGETVASPRTPVSAVPEIPAGPAPRQRASAVRLTVLSTALAGMIGFLAWDTVPELSRSEPFQIAFGTPASQAETSSDDPLTPHVRQSIAQELRLAAMMLQMREGQENLGRLWNDARALAANLGSLASGVESLKAEMEAVRDDATAGLLRLEARLNTVEVAAAPLPIELGNPSLQEATLLGDPQYAQEDTLIAQAGQPTTTGAVPDIAAPPQASVKVSFNKPKSRAKTARPIGGWLVHNVRDDLALVEGEGVHYEVRTGEELPGAGIVRAIKKRGEKWVVLTSKGVITEIQ
jgi:hypothetical protein